MHVSIQYSADVWYIGQSYHLEVPLALDTPDPLAVLYRDFLTLHDRIYGHATEQPAAIVNLRSVHRAGGSDHLDEGDYRPIDTNPGKPPRTIRVAGDAHRCRRRYSIAPQCQPVCRSPAPPSWSRTTPRRWSNLAGMDIVLENGNLLLTRGD